MVKKAIILLGGSGTRLRPVTLSTNKHLLPVFNKPVFYYPLSLLMLSNIRDFLFVVNKGEINSFKNILKNTDDLGIKVSYIEQDKPGGIPQAITLGKNFVKREQFAVILGDNFFYGSNLPEILKFEFKKKNILTFTYPTAKPNQFGILETNKKGKIVSLKEKPMKSNSNLAITGLYVFDYKFFEFVKEIKPSSRDELEIIDILNFYKQKLKNVQLGRGDVWFDLGTYEDLFFASEFVRNIEERQLLKIACLEEIALNKKWINKTNLKNRIRNFSSSSYSDYLKNLIK